MIDTIQFPRKLDEKGYVSIYTEEEGWIKEHIFIVQEFIGRNVTKEETIHHEDFNKQNNELDNLVLFPTRKSHTRFHRQLKQFGYTNPRRSEIKELKNNMNIERKKNIK